MKIPHQYPFEKLRVWQAAREIGKQVYLTTSTFPRSEIYGLTSQCNRAAVSVAVNLAEGSLMELSCLLVISSDLGMLSADSEQQLRSSIEQLSRQLNALHRSQRSRID